MTSHDRFDRIHETALPERLVEQWGRLAGSQARGRSSLAFRLPDGRAYAYHPNDSSIRLVPGADAETVVELDADAWNGLWDSTETVFGLVMSQRAKMVSGDVSEFVRWEPALRVLYEELPPYDPNAPLLGRDGREIDPTTTFRPDDDPEAMADFLRVTGYIVVREVLPATEVEGLVEAAENARVAAREDDGHSWWSTHQDGRKVLGRVLDGGKDARLLALPSDPRLLRVVALSDFDLEATETEGVSVLYKRSGVVFDGKADQPWHRDCGLGGHKLMCPLMNGSLFLTPANRGSGELRFLPGSWKTAGCHIDSQDYDVGIGIEAGPGDFSLHYGDGLHAGTPPASQDGPFRWSVVFEYGPIGREREQSQEHYDELMMKADASALHSS